jgi:hypothetical protein
MKGTKLMRQDRKVSPNHCVPQNVPHGDTLLKTCNSIYFFEGLYVYEYIKKSVLTLLFTLQLYNYFVIGFNFI